MIVGLQQDIQISVAIQVAEFTLMDTLAVRGNGFFEIPFTIAVPDVYSGVVAGAGIAHLADEDVQVAVAVDVPDFTSMAVDDLAQRVPRAACALSIRRPPTRTTGSAHPYRRAKKPPRGARP